MTTQEKTIYRLLRHWRSLQTELSAMKSGKAPNERADHQQSFCLHSMALQIEGWLAQLPGGERYVLKHHLIDGICWDKVRRDYGKHGHSMKSMATLRRMQASAISKMAARIR